MKIPMITLLSCLTLGLVKGIPLPLVILHFQDIVTELYLISSSLISLDLVHPLLISGALVNIGLMHPSQA